MQGIAPTLIMVRVDLGISVKLAACDYSSKEIPSNVERGNLPRSFVNDSVLHEEWRVTPWRGQVVSCDPHPKYACRDAPRDQALDRTPDGLAHCSPLMRGLMYYPVPTKLSLVALRPHV